MQGVITGPFVDATGTLCALTCYTDDIVLTNGDPPANTAPYSVDTIRLPNNPTNAQVRAAVQPILQMRRDTHALATAVGVNKLVVQIAG